MPDGSLENRALNAKPWRDDEMTVERLVVVGASLAGLRAVEAARKTGFDGPITLIGAERHLPYDRPPLSKEFLDAAEPGVEGLVPFFRSDDTFANELNVELLLGTPATGLDVERKLVLVGDREVAYDALVIATGSQLRTLPGSEHLEECAASARSTIRWPSARRWIQVRGQWSSALGSSDPKLPPARRSAAST